MWDFVTGLMSVYLINFFIKLLIDFLTVFLAVIDVDAVYLVW